MPRKQVEQPTTEAEPPREKFPTFGGESGRVSAVALASLAAIETIGPGGIADSGEHIPRGERYSPEQLAVYNRLRPSTPPETTPAGMLPPPFEGESPYPQVPHYHADKPKGHRCAWSWRWTTARWGIVGPDESMPLNSMSPLEKMLELHDYYDRAAVMENVACGDVLRNCDPETGRHPQPEQVDQRLRICRARTREALAPWDLLPPDRIRSWRWRKGWKPADATGHVLDY